VTDLRSLGMAIRSGELSPAEHVAEVLDRLATDPHNLVVTLDPDGARAAAAALTEEAIEGLVPRFVELYRSGEKRSPATAAVAQLISEGVDPNDSEAIDAWIEANRHRLDPS
jgi:hypothetical protein